MKPLVQICRYTATLARLGVAAAVLATLGACAVVPMDPGYGVVQAPPVGVYGYGGAPVYGRAPVYVAPAPPPAVVVAPPVLRLGLGLGWRGGHGHGGGQRGRPEGGGRRHWH